MDARILLLRDVTQADETRWRALAGSALEPNPTLEPAALRAAVAHIPSWGRLPLLQVIDGSELVLCALARPVGRWHRLPLRAVTSRPDDGPVPLFFVNGTPLVDRARARAAIATLLAALSSGDVRPGGGRRPALFVVERWKEDGAVAAAWHQACDDLSLRIATSERWARPAFVREDAPEGGSLAWLDRDHAKKVRRRMRQLAEQLGGPMECRDRSADPTAVDDFIRLEAAGWKGRGGTALVADAGRAAAFAEACRRWASDGRLVVLSLEAGGEVVAIRCAVRSGAGLFLVKSTYDERWSRFGPGLVLLAATIDYFLSQTDASWIDTCCAPSNEFFPGVLPHRLPVETSTTGLNSAGRTALGALPKLQAAAARVRSSARRAPVAPTGTGPRTDPRSLPG